MSERVSVRARGKDRSSNASKPLSHSLKASFPHHTRYTARSPMHSRQRNILMSHKLHSIIALVAIHDRSSTFRKYIQFSSYAYESLYYYPRCVYLPLWLLFWNAQLFWLSRDFHNI